MTIQENTTAQRLMNAFMQFHRAERHRMTVMEYKPSEIWVLFCIRRGISPDSPDMKVSEISKRLHVTSPTVTQLLKSLEAQGLIERRTDPTDRRAVGITLTAKGEMVVEKAAEAHTAAFQDLIDYLGEEESSALAELLSKVVLYYKSKEASAIDSHWNGDDEA